MRADEKRKGLLKQKIKLNQKRGLQRKYKTAELQNPSAVLSEKLRHSAVFDINYLITNRHGGSAVANQHNQFIRFRFQQRLQNNGFI